MAEVAQHHQDQLTRIKENIRRSYEAFRHNYDRFNEFRRFVYETSLTDADITLLSTLSRPALEFNILEAYLSRLIGEFSKQEPSFEVGANDHVNVDTQMIDVVEQIIRNIMLESSRYHVRTEIYKDMLSGGFSVAKVFTDYKNSMSFDQVIDWMRVYDPTLCGFDELARESHKGDGRYCFELFPMEKELFMEEYPDIPLERISFRRDFDGFNWSYLNGKTPVVMVAKYYEKEMKRVRIVKTTEGKVMRLKEYQEMLDRWTEEVHKPGRSLLEVPPGIVGKPRWTQLEEIHEYKLMENMVLEHKKTDFSMLPLVFFDGNSAYIKQPKNGNVSQLTRPSVYHAKDAQRLKNFAGISLANEIENIMQHKLMVAKEALPKEEEYLQAYKDIQKANVLVFNSFFEQNPDQPINNPIREVAKVPAPPEIMQAFSGADSTIQNILGSYDASLGINNNQLSGVAIVEGATQSNATAMPYIVGFMQGFQRVGEIILDLIPKYCTTPRTMPIMDAEGKRAYVMVNQPGKMKLQYDADALNIRIEAGVNFQVQKSRALQQIVAMMQASKPFGDFMNQKGLPILLDNIEIRGIDKIKEMAEQWMQQMQQQQAQEQQMQQQEMQNNPLVMKNQIEQAKVQQHGMIEAQKMQLDSLKNKQQFAIDMAQLQQDQAKVMADIRESQQATQVEMVKAATERFAHEADLEMKRADQSHRHLKEATQLHQGQADQTHRHLKEATELHHKVSSSPKAQGETHNG